MVDFQSRDTRRDRAEADSGHDQADAGPADEEGEESDPFSAGVGFAIVTVGADRTVDQDAAGEAVMDILGDAGEVVMREVIDDRYDGVQSTVGGLVDRGDVGVVVTVGGTGVQPADVTIEAVTPMLDKQLPGVGELIRRICAADCGTAVVRIRAMGGVIDGVPVFCLPGDPAMARTAAAEVVAPEAEPLADLAAVPAPDPE